MSYVKRSGFSREVDKRVTTDPPIDGQEYVRKDGGWAVATGGGGGGGDPAWDDVTGKPSTFPPSSHTHVIDDVTGLQTALDGKQASGSYLADAPSDGDSYARRNAEWIVIPRFLTYVKLADTTKNNDITWADDVDLVSETLVANAVYRLELLLMTQSDAATDLAFRVQRSGLSDADMRLAGDLDNAASAVFTWGTQQNIAGAGATARRMGNYIGWIITGDDTGSVSVQWRQQTTGAGNSTLAKGSMLMLRRVA